MDVIDVIKELCVEIQNQEKRIEQLKFKLEEINNYVELHERYVLEEKKSGDIN